MNTMIEETKTKLPDAKMVEKLVLSGDLSDLTPSDRVKYYSIVCESLGLNPLTKPFQYIRLNNRLTLYAGKDATDQLRKRHKVSVKMTGREVNPEIGLCSVDVMASMPDGRRDFATGSVSIVGLKGDNLANAIMKAETKAKRRVTLSICGLGWTDETEVDSIPNAEEVSVDVETGEVVEDEKNGQMSSLSEDLFRAQESASQETVFPEKDNSITEAQSKFLRSLIESHVVTIEERADVEEWLGDEPTKLDASKKIEHWKGIVDERKKPDVTVEEAEPEEKTKVWSEDYTKPEIVDIINNRLRPKMNDTIYKTLKGDLVGSGALSSLNKGALVSLAERLKSELGTNPS
jgi:hypothetical protein